MPLDPSVFYDPTITPSTGWVRDGRIAGIPVLVMGWEVTAEESFQKYPMAANPPLGWNQSVLHSAGTSEVQFQVRGDLSVEAAGLLQFLDPANRGSVFPIAVAQAGVVDFLQRCLCDNFTLNGESDGRVGYSVSGRCLDWPIQGTTFTSPGYHHPIPAWTTGNALMTQWTLSHTVPLTPVWRNDQNPLPAYYRPGPSDFRLAYQTAGQLLDHDTLGLGIGGFVISGSVQRRGISSQGHDVRFYPVEVSNLSVDAFPLEPGGAVTIATGVSFAGYPDGV